MQDAFLNRLEALLKEDFSSYLECLNQIPKKAVHINTTIVKQKELLKPLLKDPIPFDSDGFYIEEEKPGKTIFHTLGLFYVQEPSAMMPVLATPFAKDAIILDLCASPGGKTLQLANLAPDGIIFANEPNPARARKLVSNIERLGLKNVIVTQMTSLELKQKFQGYFDYILVDAPCSLEGTFRKDPLAIKLWSQDRVLEMAKIQKELLKDAVTMLRTNGKLVYSTCTFSKEENEEVVLDLLLSSPLKLLKVDQKLFPYTRCGLKEFGKEVQKTRRGYPFLIGEGQYFAVFQKQTEEKINSFQTKMEELEKEEENYIVPAIQEVMTEIPFSIKKYHHHFIAVPKKLENEKIPALKTDLCFVKIGELKKGRFIFHHQFARCYGIYFKNQVHLSIDDPLLKKYLSGLEIEVEIPDGWGVICVEGFPLGLFKASHGILKNHYPKGLRN